MAQRRWCFTAYKATAPEFVEDKMNYLIFQKERCPKSGKLHYQGYVKFKSPMRLGGIKKLFKDVSLHIEICKGDDQSNITYCTKEESRVDGPWEFGKCDRAKEDLNDCLQLALKGKISEVKVKYPGIYSIRHKGLEKLYEAKPRNFKTEVVWIYGPTGSGKSRAAWDLCPSAYSKASEHRWWDGYCCNDEVIIDDYGGAFDFKYLLRLLDRYPMNVEVKGGVVQFVTKKIVVTSLEHPEYYVPACEDPRQLMRRIETLQNTGGVEGNTMLLHPGEE